MQRFTRREWLQHAAGCLVGLASGAVGGAPVERRCTLSIGTYSLKGLTLDEGIKTVADIGYDGIEIAVATGFDGEPSKLTPDRRRELRRNLAERRLKLTALMENLSPATEDGRQKLDRERLSRVVDLSRDLGGATPPLVQTVLGGGKWEEKKNLFRDRLGGWLEVFAPARVVLAIKPHRGGALSQPSEAVWLIEQLDKSPWLRMVYDYSHYAFRNLSVADTVRTALPWTAHLAVKDAVQVGERVEFQLPGASEKFDYAELLRLFHTGGFGGDVCCEVSSMVSGKPGYDPVAAARTCYRNMARAFTEAKVPRG